MYATRNISNQIFSEAGSLLTCILTYFLPDQIVSCLNQMCDSLDQFASCGEENTPSGIFVSFNHQCSETVHLKQRFYKYGKFPQLSISAKQLDRTNHKQWSCSPIPLSFSSIQCSLQGASGSECTLWKWEWLAKN